MHLLLSVRPLWRIQRATLLSWLEQMPNKIGMQRISPAIVEKKGPLLMGIVLLAESHIAVHLDFRARWGTVDIFACKSFPAEQAIKETERGLKVQVVDQKILPRGLEHLPNADTGFAQPVQRTVVSTGTAEDAQQ